MNIEFKQKGFTVFHDPAVGQFLDIDTINWSQKGTINLQVEQGTPDIELRKNKVQNFIIEKYLSTVYKSATVSYVEITQGIDEEYTSVWHHDFAKDDVTVNIGVLLYFDTLDKETGGYLQIKKPNNPNSVNNYYPVAGDVLFLNQTPEFVHRVEPLRMPLPRRVAIFNFWVDK